MNDHIVSATFTSTLDVTSADALWARISDLSAENDQLRAALLQIAQLTQGASSWGPGLARLALIEKYEVVSPMLPV